MNRAIACLSKGGESPWLPRVFRVVGRKVESHDVVTLELDSPEGAFNFAPGQFNMLYAFGKGEVPISMSGSPSQTSKLVHTVRAVGKVSQSICELLPGDSLGVRGPYGTAWPVEHAQGKDVLLVAGGIGLAPLRPVIYSILAQRQQFGRVAVLYGARTPKEMIFCDELPVWVDQTDLAVQLTVDHLPKTSVDPSSESIEVELHRRIGSVGVVPALLPKVKIDSKNSIAMVCGPEIMMRFSVDGLKKLGVPEDKIFISMERNMKCAVGFCGHCQFGSQFICRDGPVYSHSVLRDLLKLREF